MPFGTLLHEHKNLKQTGNCNNCLYTTDRRYQPQTSRWRYRLKKALHISMLDCIVLIEPVCVEAIILGACLSRFLAQAKIVPDGVSNSPVRLMCKTAHGM